MAQPFFNLTTEGPSRPLSVSTARGIPRRAPKAPAPLPRLRPPSKERRRIAPTVTRRASRACTTHPNYVRSLLDVEPSSTCEDSFHSRPEYPRLGSWTEVALVLILTRVCVRSALWRRRKTHEGGKRPPEMGEGVGDGARRRQRKPGEVCRVLTRRRRREQHGTAGSDDGSQHAHRRGGRR